MNVNGALLFEPYGIEISVRGTRRLPLRFLLIEPYGIEISKADCSGGLVFRF